MTLNAQAPLVRVSGMTRRFGQTAALTDVSFTIMRGEILDLIGPNGAGKTTLLECFAGLQPANTGVVQWQGAPLAPDRRKVYLFYVPENIEPYLGLITPHPLLLMDEPFDGFDLKQTRETMMILGEVAKRGRTLLLAIHQLSDAERMCRRFVLSSPAGCAARGA